MGIEKFQCSNLVVI